jgi:Flp pilus assembly protein TadB
MTTAYDDHDDPRIADAGLRAGDGDRERVAEQLRKAHAEGRLDADELSERIDRCLQARTFGELRRLTVDLRQPEHRDGRPLAPRRPRPPIRIVLAAILVLWTLGAATHGHPHVIGLWVVLAFAFLATRLVRAVRA